MNILIKLMSIVSLVIAPTLAQLFNTKPEVHNLDQKKIEWKTAQSTAILEKN
jgi:K(+)-stimulated pyrophosphate-energized sodium pump